LRGGPVQQLQLRMKQAGARQVRVAVRDRESGHIGSVSEFVEVPDLAKGNLALSGIALSGEGPEPGSIESASLLRFRAGQKVSYAYQVMNALPAADGSTNMEVPATLYRDGTALGTGAPMGIDPKGHADPKRIGVTTNQCRRPECPEKRAKASQTVDFEVIE
jgi:hypothetical protein